MRVNEMYGMRARRSLVGAILTMVVVTTPLVLTPSRTPSSWSVMTAAQDPAAAEATLGLDRPARRVIQQGLRNEGFNPGAPDGLFGPRTRGAIRRWQEAQEEPATGYLNVAQAGLLRAAGAPRQSLPEIPTSTPPTAESATPAPTQVVTDVPRQPESGTAMRPAPQTSEPSTAPEQTADCDGWNTEEFFETAMVSTVTACLAAGADIEARNDNDTTPLHMAAAHNGGSCHDRGPTRRRSRHRYRSTGKQ